MKYSIETERYIQAVKDTGFNIWAMLGIYKRRSKLREDIPEPVITAVCLEYIKRQGSIRQDFPYFLFVLQAKTHAHFAEQNVLEGLKYKKEPSKLKVTIG